MGIGLGSVLRQLNHSFASFIIMHEPADWNVTNNHSC